MEHTISQHYLTEQESHHGHFVLAVLAALTMAFIGALVWVGVTLITGWHPGLLALVIAVMVGVSVRVSGRGSHFIFGVIGVVFTLLSCLVGEIGVSLQLATTPWFDLYGVLMHVDLISLTSATINQISTVMMVIYGVSAYIAYTLSIFVRK
jgi:hypothetical protein